MKNLVREKWPSAAGEAEVEIFKYEEVMKAIWNQKVIAESDQTEVVEGNHYFPRESVDSQFLKESSATTVCGWKGTANYFDLVVDGETNEQAAWYYADPKPEANNIRGYVAFWKGVEVTA